jgi:hypothetical protein
MLDAILEHKATAVIAAAGLDLNHRDRLQRASLLDQAQAVLRDFRERDNLMRHSKRARDGSDAATAEMSGVDLAFSIADCPARKYWRRVFWRPSRGKGPASGCAARVKAPGMPIG